MSQYGGMPAVVTGTIATAGSPMLVDLVAGQAGHPYGRPRVADGYGMGGTSVTRLNIGGVAGGSGGGAGSAILLAGNPLIVAGGGGGGGVRSGQTVPTIRTDGGNAGQVAGDGLGAGIYGGRGANGLTPGAGGRYGTPPVGSSFQPGTVRGLDGTASAGNVGGNGGDGGGGGGGGYAGGGGGAYTIWTPPAEQHYGGGGGAGSSFVAPDARITSSLIETLADLSPSDWDYPGTVSISWTC